MKDSTGMLQSMGSQKVGYDLATEQQQQLAMRSAWSARSFLDLFFFFFSVTECLIEDRIMISEVTVLVHILLF